MYMKHVKDMLLNKLSYELSKKKKKRKIKIKQKRNSNNNKIIIIKKLKEIWYINERERDIVKDKEIQHKE